MPLLRSENKIVRTVQSAQLKDGHSIGIVEFDDNRFGIVFDGKVVSAMSFLLWSRDDLKICFDAFENLVFMHGGAVARSTHE